MRENSLRDSNIVSPAACDMQLPRTCGWRLTKPHYSLQESSRADQFAIKAMHGLFDMLEGGFKASAARSDNFDLVWSANLDVAVAQRGKAREAAAKQRLLEVEQVEKDLLEAVQQGIAIAAPCDEEATGE